MTAEQLAAITGIVLSLAFSYIPGVKDWFDTLQPGKKQALMGALLIAVAGTVFGLSCSGIISAVSCSQSGAIGLVNVLINALIANQSTYLITRK